MGLPKFSDGRSQKLSRAEPWRPIGPNGTGKTTLRYLTPGRLRPFAGTVHPFGADVRELSGSERGWYVSLLPQKEPTDFEYTVLEYVLLGRAPYLKTLQVAGEDRQCGRQAPHVIIMLS